ncbi:MAG: 6-carboxytetrahydropterin synthase QueD [Treponema porcinum]|uniref:6-carboxytetrahydropterin synthase QueD n=1 Tax=Treponema porcinum TaxID=261392 RepID=UPI002A7EEEB1|nr:6-carboxytetrahydropterin synthase QueD [Treponema porcinum]MDY5047615.1 6-carboxytetrahydropterin synthase QueD [Treponema porcinum]
MYEVRVTADFAAAHFLKDYNGKCENLHGHNYKVYAHVRGNRLDEGGMLLDFTKLKSVLRGVCAELDHTNLNDMPVFKQNLSAERIAKYIFDAIIERELLSGEDLRKGEGKTSAWLQAVDVFETDTSRARYMPDDLPE